MPIDKKGVSSMSSELSNKDKADIGKLFGEAMGEQMVKVFTEIKQTAQRNRELADARWETMQTKLDTIISEIRRREVIT